MAEGVTTYMGDLVLFESGVFDKKQYAKEFTSYLTRHFTNDGRLNMSVADSSFDTWLDGYEMGIPDRKSSIYTEGALLAFLVDVEIRKLSNDKKSLHDVIKLLYERFGKVGEGYTEKDYLDTVKEVSESDFIHSFYETYIAEANDLTQLLKEGLDYMNLTLTIEPSNNATNRVGLKGINEKDGSYKVVHVKEDSTAYQAGLSREDYVLAINNIKLSSNFDQWLNYFKEDQVELTVVRNSMTRKVLLGNENENQFFSYKVS